MLTSCVKISEQNIEHYVNYSVFNLKVSKSEVTKTGILMQICLEKSLSFGSKDYTIGYLVTKNVECASFLGQAG